MPSSRLLYDSAQTPTYPTNLKPYLELPHLLSLTWLAYPILSIIFVIFRLEQSLSTSQETLASAKTDLLASCQAAERAATAAASFPRYMAAATNEQFVDAVNGSLAAARGALVISLTIMEAIINFIIDTYRSTFLCFVELVIRGGLAILISAVQELNSLVQAAASGISSAVSSGIQSANSIITTAINDINKIPFTPHINPPQIPTPDLSSLQNIQLPPSFQDSLNKLNDTLPSFNELKQKLDAIIDTPFELLKKDINDTFTGLSFNSSVLPVPEQRTVTFCNQMDTSFVDDIGKDLIKVTKIGIIILILAALLLIGFNCFVQWWKWRCQKRHLEYTRQAWSTDPTIINTTVIGMPQITLTDHNLLMLQANGAHPLLTRIANSISRRFNLSTVQHIHLSWFFHYIFHPPALACFLIGVVGILAVEIQLLAIHPLEQRFNGVVNATVADFSNTIATSINENMYNQSATYANDVNSRVDVVQSTVNDGLFGWVNGTTTTLNDTLVGFYDEVQSLVTTVFGGSILEQPAQEFINCFIGSKVEAIEHALTFLHDNLKIDVPRVNQSVLVLSQGSVDEATRPIALAAVGSGDDSSGGIAGKIISAYVKSLKKERITFAIFLGIWGFVVLMGICILIYHSHRNKKRKDEQWPYLEGGAVDPFHSEKKQPMLDADIQSNGLRSFTPLPSPRQSRSIPIDVTDGRSGSPNPTSSPRSTQSLKPLLLKSVDSTKDHLKSLPRIMISKPMQHFRNSKAKSTSTVAEKELPPVASDGDSMDGRRNTAWFGRFASMMSRDEKEPSPISESPIGSPLKRQKTKYGLPAHPKLRQDSPQTVPKDVFPDDEATLQQPMVPTPFAPPLHHGFNDAASWHAPSKQRIPPSAMYYAVNDDPFADLTHSHRRTSSVPNTMALTPTTRLLTTTHARKSSSINPSNNPFATPFDHEQDNHTNAEQPYPIQPYDGVTL